MITAPGDEEFLAGLETVPWFSRIGEPLPADAGVVRLLRWEDWPGPLELAVAELSLRQQALYDRILADAGVECDPLRALWEQIHRAVFRLATPMVPYDPDQDCYHAPTQAVWQAAWTAGLVGWCLRARRPLPDDLAEQWKWLLAGHWPAGYAWIDNSGQTGPLLVL